MKGIRKRIEKIENKHRPDEPVRLTLLWADDENDPSEGDVMRLKWPEETDEQVQRGRRGRVS